MNKFGALLLKIFNTYAIFNYLKIAFSLMKNN